MTPAMRSGYDPLSAIDTFKKYGLDSSKAGRLKYAAEHGIGGQPFSAKWNGSIREDVIQRYRR
ncbi:hypothetical protein N7470_003451 [Penicillium chermesinum]|nr:hypothetical protein N7470_003451 [Penicillium chermesinum]